jgi:tetratricopeptide (TPR) repeat protein
MCIITPYIGTRAVVYKEVFALLPDGHPHRAQLRISILTSEAALARTGIRADDTVVDSGASMPISLLDRRQLARRLNYLEGLQGDRRADRLVEIGTLGWLEFQKAPSRTLLRETVDTLRQAQNEIAPSHPSRFTVLRTLGDALRASFRMTFQDLPSLSGAISAYEEAIQVCPAGNDARPVTMSDLAALLDDRSLLVGDPDSLRAAVDLHRQAISMLPRGHEARVECVISFLASLDHLFERTRDVDAGEEAVVLYEQTLANGEMTDAQRVQLTAHFGLAKINRFLYTADTTNIDEAIRLQREALATMDRTQAGQAQLERPAIVTNLAIALHMRFEQTDDLRALDESVRLHADSLERMPLADPHRSRALMSLANALQERGRRVDDLSSVRKALDYYAQAALLRPRGHSGRAFLLMNRSGAVAWVAKKTGSLVEMSEALSAALEALSLQPPESPQEPAIRGNISRMLMQTYLQIGFLPFLAKAILGFRQVIDLTPRSDPQRKLYLVDLATALIAAFEKFKTPFLLDESAALVDELEASTPVDHPIMLEVYEARARLCTTAGTRYWQPSNAIRTLTRSLAMTEVNLVERVNRTVVGLLLLDRELAVAASDTLGSEGNGLLLDLYKETIKLVPRYVASLGDDARQQLRELQQIRALGAQAAVFTLAQNRPKIALHLVSGLTSVCAGLISSLAGDGPLSVLEQCRSAPEHVAGWSAAAHARRAALAFPSTGSGPAIRFASSLAQKQTERPDFATTLAAERAAGETGWRGSAATRLRPLPAYAHICHLGVRGRRYRHRCPHSRSEAVRSPGGARRRQLHAHPPPCHR